MSTASISVEVLIKLLIWYCEILYLIERSMSKNNVISNKAKWKEENIFDEACDHSSNAFDVAYDQTQKHLYS